ncbi:putative selenocysteine lyase protein [Neofusicoccum parvum UCRNP2]|uniref:Putative selenocysteine lyase protein n=1 Tax=Botryosphaeria parva (strain UCR-NP2) TaxID=1287680 RepID=R1EMY4_BOTPV|nr:putative selenocysteine lyase protein [Neofusicoccum parvum UCRNP2]
MTEATQSKFDQYRQLVPLLSQPGVTYLNSAFAPPANNVIRQAIDKYLDEALHAATPKPGWQARAEEARGLVGQYINASPSSIAFTRDTTEGLGYFAQSLPLAPGDNVVILDTEHPNHAYTWLSLRSSAGIEVRQVPTDATCFASASTFAPFVDGRTRAIGLSSIMFHSGQRNDVAGISAAFRPRGVHVLVDCTQHAGFAPLDVRALGVSAASFSLHKGLNCPVGLACLYVEPGALRALKTPPPIVGYGAVANVRADLVAPSDEVVYHGTARRFEHLNLSYIAAAAAQASLSFYLDTMGPEAVEEHLYALGDVLREGCNGLGIGIVGPTERQRHSPHLYVLQLLDPAWKPYLLEHGIYVQHYRLGIRVSFSFYNNVGDVQRLMDVLKMGMESSIPAL